MPRNDGTRIPHLDPYNKKKHICLGTSEINYSLDSHNYNEKGEKVYRPPRWTEGEWVDKTYKELICLTCKKSIDLYPQDRGVHKTVELHEHFNDSDYDHPNDPAEHYRSCRVKVFCSKLCLLLSESCYRNMKEEQACHKHEINSLEDRINTLTEEKNSLLKVINMKTGERQ